MKFSTLNNIIDQEIKKHGEKPLNEMVSDVVYHYTSISNILNILQHDILHLTPYFASYDETNVENSKFYYMSLTTSRFSDIGFQGDTKQPVRITLDGRKINQNFKTKRVDYWKFGKDPNKFKDMGGDDEYIRKSILKYNEMEDRLISDKNQIDGFSKYIISIDIILPKDEMNNIYYAHNNPSNVLHRYPLFNTLKGILIYCKKRNITCHVYDDKKDFNYKQTQNSINNLFSDNNFDVDKFLEYEKEMNDPKKYLDNKRIISLYAILLFNNKNYDYIKNYIHNNLIKLVGKEETDKFFNKIDFEIGEIERNYSHVYHNEINTYLKSHNLSSVKQINKNLINKLSFNGNDMYGFIDYLTKTSLALNNLRGNRISVVKLLVYSFVLDMKKNNTSSFNYYMFNKFHD